MENCEQKEYKICKRNFLLRIKNYILKRRNLEWHLLNLNLIIKIYVSNSILGVNFS